MKSLSSVESVTPGTIYWLDSFRCIHEMFETRDKVLPQCTEPIHIGKLCLLSSVFVMETKQISSEIFTRCCRTFNSGLYGYGATRSLRVAETCLEDGTLYRNLFVS